MASPLGFSAHSPPPDTQPFWSNFRNPKEHTALKKPEAAAVAESISPKRPKLAKKVKPFSAKSRTREPSPTKNSPPEEDAERRPSFTPTPCSTPPLDVFELPPTSPRGQSTTRPKHIPIVIPDYQSFGRQSPVNETRSGSFSTFVSSASGSPQPNFAEYTGYGVTVRNTSVDSFRERPRHVEIKIPDWAQPVIKRPNIPPRLSLTKSTFVDTFADVVPLSPPDLSTPSPAISQVSSNMDSHQSEPSPTGLYTSLSNKGSSAYLSSAHSSQSSLVGMRAEYESASEAESTHDESQRPSHGYGSSMGGQSLGGLNSPPIQTPASNSNLSGLVCNVHRTTGKEPHPLVGATTTILGDKLYVFGGRRLSRAKPQLTSNLYELDLIRRHWTKLETKGDIPNPRYFHSVCALGDTKLVCYGGMSPAPGSESGGDAQAEVVVMSDIHIYDAPTRVWKKVATSDSPQGRYAHCTSILPSGAFFGSANAPMSAVHHNVPGTNPNQGTLGVSLDGTGGAEMVVVGGQDSANHYIEQISVFNLRSLKWTGTTGMGRSCGAYRSVVAPLTTMTAEQIGAGPHADTDADDEDTDSASIGSGAPMLIYSNYNFLDVKLELQVRLTDGTLTEKAMRTEVSPPGLRFPNGGVIDNHFVVSGTFLTSSKQEYALWALDLRTLSWSRIDASGSIFSQGSWNRGVLWSRRNSFVILGNRKRSLVDDYNNRRINFSNICLVELESFGLYDNPRTAEPSSAYVSASAAAPQLPNDLALSGRQLPTGAESLGVQSMALRELADMDFLAIDGTRIAVNSRLISRRWGPYFTHLLRESLVGASGDGDASTLRGGASGHGQRNSILTITPLNNSGSNANQQNNNSESEVPDVRLMPPPSRPRLLYLPHTAPTLQAMLHFLYTGTLPSPPSALATPQIYCSLLQLARPYKIDGLLEAVVQRLHESLDGRNAAAIFNAAAMGAGGGDGVQFTSPNGRVRESIIPLRGASLANADSLTVNGFGRSSTNLRIDTDVANGRNTRNTLRPGESLTEETDEEEIPSSATDSMSESDASMSARSLTGRGDRDKEVWSGALSAVVGLQKRGLRGLMEGRRMRERGRSEGMADGARVGLGIA
jgi:hypothetical protein